MNELIGQKPFCIVHSFAPVRICDNGGWTDTWFARHGKIFNIAVTPYAEAQLEVYQCKDVVPSIRIVAENFGESYIRVLGQKGWDRHPLLEAAIERLGFPVGTSARVTIYSEAPSGASTGTSAAVSVALIGALDFLRGGHLSPKEIAETAHAIETQMLGLQCGIQDQLCSAFGGINYIEMHEYPNATVSQLSLDPSGWQELERRLVLIYLGHSHSSSKVHEQVIANLEGAGSECRALQELRKTAEKSRDAVVSGRLDLLGQAMVENTRAQANLHPELVSSEAWRVIEIAQAHGAAGWKVNGAGGNGGSVTLLCNPLSDRKRAMIREIEQEVASFRHIPIRLSHRGLSVYATSLGKSLQGQAISRWPSYTGRLCKTTPLVI